MEHNESIMLQKQVKDNSEDLQSEFLDMKNWEQLMKRKEQELFRQHKPQTIPPVRSKSNKNVTNANLCTKSSKRMKSYDYTLKAKSDADKACTSLKEKEQSEDLCESISTEQLEKDHNKATEYKQKGNYFVQQKEWGEAIASYNKAIDIYPYDAVFYANRALCYLKQDNLYSAEADCTSAIQIDNTYVKAYHRRATTRMGLRQYKEAKQDIEKILTLEPSNKETKALLSQVNKQLENSAPIIISEKDLTDDIPVEKKIAEKLLDDMKSNENIIDIKQDNKENSIHIKSNVEPKTINVTKQKNSHIPDWLPEKDNVKIIELVGKLPHLRSKESFKIISVQEADLSKPFKEKIETCFAIKDVNLSHISDVSSRDHTTKCHKNVTKIGPELQEDFTENYVEMPSIPKTTVQFVINWRKYTSSDFRYRYLKQLPPASLPKIFKDSLETSIFSDILAILKTEFVKRQEPIFSYLKNLTDVRRFRALIMFISNSEKQDLKLMFSCCKTFEKISQEELLEVQNKYEI